MSKQIPITGTTESREPSRLILDAIMNQSSSHAMRSNGQTWPTPAVYPDPEQGEEDSCAVHVLDQPGPGGAPYEYFIMFDDPHGVSYGTIINFQKGGIAEAGPNGLTIEALLSVVRHRLTCFEAGPFRCNENAAALIAVSKAMHALQVRTQRRRDTGIEGKQVEHGPYGKGVVERIGPMPLRLADDVAPMDSPPA